MRLSPSRLAVAIWLGGCAALYAFITPQQAAQLPPPANHRVDFAKEIKPIFESSCIECHGRGKSEGGLKIDSRKTLLKGGDSGPAIIVGKSADSLLIELVQGFDPDSRMPKKGSHLTPQQIGLLRAWIDQGAAWGAGINFARLEPKNLTPRRPTSPSGPKNANPVDLFLQPYFAVHPIKAVPPVGDRTYARRVYLDVIGLLPSPEEMEAFVADQRADKRERLVGALLADNFNYALHWMTFWNDALRNDYRGTGYIDGGRQQITQWLYAALATNKPYDRFVAQLVDPTAESAGFSKGIVWRGVVNASQTPQMQTAQNISQVFMGVNLKCASCHNSFINDLTLADAYGLAGIYSDGALEMVRCDKPTGKRAPLKFLYPELGAIDPKANKAARLKRLAEIITGPIDGRLTRTIVNRYWHKFMGRGLVEPVDDMEKTAWNADLLDWLASDLADHHYDLKHLIEVILTSRAYQRPSVTFDEKNTQDYVFTGPLVRRMSAEQFRDALGELTGIWYDKPAAQIDYTLGQDNPSKKAVPAKNHDKVRAVLANADALQVALGRPNREQTVTTRSSVATTLEALELTNGRELAEIIRRGAQNALAEKAPSTEDLITRLYGRALGRKPTAEELAMAKEVVGQPAQPAGVEDLLWALAMLPEFQLILEEQAMQVMETWNRRDFLKSASAATLSALAAGYPRAMLANDDEKITPTADTVIVLWMAGGMAHTETFDPKRYTPYEKGLASNAVLSTFPAIDSAVDNIKLSQGLENVARVMDLATLIRSYTAGDLGFILHSRHQYQWHTGYAPPQTVAAPHIGALIARTLGPLNPAIPAFIDIGQRFDLGEGEELKAFHTAGFLGSEFGPFLIANPAQAAESVRPPEGMSPARFENRDRFYRKLVRKSPVGEYGSDFQQQSLLRALDNAHRLLSSPAAKAFDLTLEPKASYDKYNTGRFGLGCLLARRLTEAGARFIEVTSEYVPFENWDTHENGHTRLITLKKSIDAPISQLVLDLEQRGLLNRTLIVLASEFSRDLMMEGRPGKTVTNQVNVPDIIQDMKYYGMHRHFTDAGSVLMVGGGMKKGYLHGKTADERPCKTIGKRVVIEDLHASILRAVGISPKLSYLVERRPFYATKDGLGKPIMDLFA